jgi:hypothetical protein
MIFKNLRLIVATACVLGLPGVALATSTSVNLGPSTGCVADCLNTEWTLTISDDTIVDSANYNLHVTLTADWPDPLEPFLNEDGVITPTMVSAVEFGIPGEAIDAKITSPGGWTTELGPLASSGCKGKNGNFTCSEGLADIVKGSSESWEWDILVDDPTEVLEYENIGDFHVGAWMTSETHENGWLVSASPSNPVPEPSAALLYGVGLLVLGRRLRRSPR